MSTYPTNLAKPNQIRTALKIYRVLAIIAGIALFVLIAATGWDLKKIVLNLLTGFVPVLPWVAEHRNTQRTEALLQRAYLAGDGTGDVTGRVNPGVDAEADAGA